MIFVILFKMGKHTDFHLSFFQIHVVGAWQDFTVITKLMKNFKSFYVLGMMSQLEMLVWILNYISRSITWSLSTLKVLHLAKWPISTWSFMWWCQFIDWLKFEMRPSSLLSFGTAYCVQQKLSSLLGFITISLCKLVSDLGYHAFAFTLCTCIHNYFTSVSIFFSCK